MLGHSVQGRLPTNPGWMESLRGLTRALGEVGVSGAVSSLAPRGGGELIGTENRVDKSVMDQHVTCDSRPESFKLTDSLRSIPS